MFVRIFRDVAIMNFASNLIRSFPVGLDRTRFAVVQFSTSAHVEIGLTEYNTSAELTV